MHARYRYNSMLSSFVDKPLKDNGNSEDCSHTECFNYNETDIHIQCIQYDISK